MNSEQLGDKVRLFAGDCRAVLAILPDNSLDSCVTDPPYHLVSIVKRFSSPAGFMGKQWDGGNIACDPDVWCEIYRVLKPGAHLVAFGGTRTSHRMVCTIEDAGFEIRDSLCWLYGTGFPKSHNQGDGWGTALKPAFEPIVLARKPLSEGTVAANVLKWGTGAINVDGCRIHADDAQGGEYTVTRLKPGATLNKTGGNWRPEEGIDYTGVMKPGRWPANVAHDGSDEVVEMFPKSNGQQGAVTGDEPSSKTNNVFSSFKGRPAMEPRNDSGSAARFFYTAKADADDRLGSKHPTIKPLDLMQWLVRLVTPKNGTILDPFAGTGTTGEAAIREGMSTVLIEREAEYQDDIRRRMRLAIVGPDERARESIKAKNLPYDPGPLFAYDPKRDFAESIKEGFRAVKERQAAGGPGWTPKEPRIK